LCCTVPDMRDANTVAQHFIRCSAAEQDADDWISNMKLQKLLYYAQGFHLALYNEPLFKDDIVAWQHRPVVPELYHALRSDRYGDVLLIDHCVDMTPIRSNKAVIELLDEVWRTYGQFAAWKLRALVWEEPPWKRARDDWNNGYVITHESMKEYFKTLLV